MSIMEYYDANVVAEESYMDRYCSCEDEPTRCDCGEIAEPGKVYCSLCLDAGKRIMQEAVRKLMTFNHFNEEQAHEFICYFEENQDQFEEKRNAKS